MSAVRKTLVGLTDLSWDIARRQSAEQGFGSVSEWFEWVVLHQQFSHSEAAALFRARRKRGERGAVVVVSDDVELPPEG